MANKGRPSKSGARTKAGRLSRAKKLKDAISTLADENRGCPNAKVLERRAMFSFVRVSKEDRLDGRNGEIDSEVCDAIGQFYALGLLNGHGHDPKDMRDQGRFWGNTLAMLNRTIGMKTASFERMSVTTGKKALYTKTDERFDRMDAALTGYDRSVLRMLIVDPLVGSFPDGREFPIWAQGLIDEALLRRGVIPAPLICFPTAHERGLLGATIRGLCVLVDAALPSRRQSLGMAA